MRSTFFLAVSGALSVMAAPSCRFAPGSSPDKNFLRRVLESEKSFFEGLGVDPRTGLTRTSIHLDPRTGMPLDTGIQGDERDEAVHLRILGSCLRRESHFEGLCTDPLGALAKKLDNLAKPQSRELRASLFRIVTTLRDLYPTQSELRGKLETLLGPVELGLNLESPDPYAQADHS